MKSKISKYDIIVEVLCLLLLCGMCLYLFINWGNLPDQIPGHYNASGEVDRWGSKGEALILPIIGWILYIGMTAAESFPQIWNTGVRVTEENKERVYRILKNMVGTVKLLMVCSFTFISINEVSSRALPVWFLPVFLILIFGPVIFFIIKLIKSK
jgi:uncharacterized membrane protein